MRSINKVARASRLRKDAQHQQSSIGVPVVNNGFGATVHDGAGAAVILGEHAIDTASLGYQQYPVIKSG